jgi:hypothetical protein
LEEFVKACLQEGILGEEDYRLHLLLNGEAQKQNYLLPLEMFIEEFDFFGFSV